MTETATLAGGCFWGVEELIRKIPGVVETVAGYAGGELANPRYEDVKTGRTGHAEAVQIVFDPEKVSLNEILDHFFRLHDPTTPNQQGNDRGSQYRSAIFYADENQRDAATRAIERAKPNWPRPIVTEVVPFKSFWKAEDYHQDYLQKYPNGYNCHYYRW